jgi:NTP pyrophosphatase (non-canonical NTP hydrolase)
MTNTTTIESLQEKLLTFAKARDWEQFHSPKNLVMALSVEASELLEHFQWLTEEESASLSPEQKAEVAEEMADVLLYLLRLSSRLDVDLLAEASMKMEKNEKRFPVARVKGKKDYRE